MREDVAALRAHLVAEAEQAKRQARYMQIRSAWHAKPPRTSSAQFYAATARTATDAWLAADARLRALDGLIVCYDSMARPHEQAQDACQSPKPTTV